MNSYAVQEEKTLNGVTCRALSSQTGGHGLHRMCLHSTLRFNWIQVAGWRVLSELSEPLPP